MNKLAACGVCMAVGFVVFSLSFLFRASAAEEAWTKPKAEERSNEMASFHGKMVAVEQAKYNKSKDKSELQAEFEKTRAKRKAERETREREGARQATLGGLLRFGGCIMIVAGAIGVLVIKNGAG